MSSLVEVIAEHVLFNDHLGSSNGDDIILTNNFLECDEGYNCPLSESAVIIDFVIRYSHEHEDYEVLSNLAHAFIVG